MNSYTVDKSDGPCDRMPAEHRNKDTGTGFFTEMEEIDHIKIDRTIR